MEARLMKWEYLMEEVPTSKETFEELLSDAGEAGWEAVTSWVIQGDAHINKGHRALLFSSKSQSSPLPQALTVSRNSQCALTLLVCPCPRRYFARLAVTNRIIPPTASWIEYSKIYSAASAASFQTASPSAKPSPLTCSPPFSPCCFSPSASSAAPPLSTARSTKFPTASDSYSLPAATTSSPNISCAKASIPGNGFCSASEALWSPARKSWSALSKVSASSKAIRCAAVTGACICARSSCCCSQFFPPPSWSSSPYLENKPAPGWSANTDSLF